MKTLSFAKQAMAVALLISAVNASALPAFFGKIAGYVGTALTLDESAAQWALGKTLGRTPAVAPSAPGVNPPVLGKDAQTFFGDEGVFRTKNRSGVWQAGDPQANPVVPSKWSTTAGEEGTRGVRNVLAFVEAHQVGCTRAARLAKAAAYAAIAYGLYKYFTKSEAAQEDQVQPEAQPEVVVVEEEAEQVVVVPTKKIVRPQPVA